MYIKSNEIALDRLYGLLTSIVSPRPIAWVGSKNVDGIANLAPFSFYNVASINPPVVSIGILNRPDGSQKDSLTNIEAQQYFSVSIVNRDHAKAMVTSSNDFAPEQNEFAESGMIEQACHYVDAVCVQSAAAVLECRLKEIIRFDSEGKTLSGNLVLGEIVGLQVEDDILDGHRIDATLIDTIGRFSGPYYVSTREHFVID